MLLLGVEAGFCLQVYIAQTYKKMIRNIYVLIFPGFLLDIKRFKPLEIF